MGAPYPELPLYVTLEGGLSRTLALYDEDNAIIVITGDTFKAQVRASYATSATLILTLAAAVTDGAAGEVTISSTKTLIGALTVGEYVWDCYRLPGGVEDDAEKFVQGAFIVTDAATDTAP